MSVSKVDRSELPEWAAVGRLPANLGRGRRLFATELQRTAVGFGKLQVFADHFGQDCRGLWQGKPLSFKGNSCSRLWKLTVALGQVIDPELPILNQLPAFVPPSAVLTTPIPDTRLVPTLIANAGEQAGWRYIDFFMSNICSLHNRTNGPSCCEGLGWIRSEALPVFDRVRTFWPPAARRVQTEPRTCRARRRRLAAPRPRPVALTQPDLPSGGGVTPLNRDKTALTLS
jgi:hypothetical protein